MPQSEKIDQLVTALVKAQGKIKGAIKDSANPFFKSNYADLESCWEAVKQPLLDNGLAVLQTMGTVGGFPSVITTLAHTSGQWVAGEQLVCAKSLTNPQELGSAITYARRYGLAAITGLVQVDDDGEAATGRGVRPGQPEEGDGDITPGHYRIPIGGWRDKSLEEIYADPKVGAERMAGRVQWYREQEQRDKKPMGPQASDLCYRISEFLVAMDPGWREDKRLLLDNGSNGRAR